MIRSDWETFYRWDWFHREQWRGGFRDRKRGEHGGSCRAVKEMLGEMGGELALDCSCGLGLKTIVLKEMGVNVVGSDACAYAVEKARELARLEGHAELEFFTSAWGELPKRTELRFDAVFNDALCWTPTREEFAASLQGCLEALNPGGILVFFGAEKGSPSDPESRKAFFEEFWQSRPKFAVEWTHEVDGVRCTSIYVRERGDMYVDGHHLFLIEDHGQHRLETATIRKPVYWDWETLESLFSDAGFSDLTTRTFPGLGNGGADITLNVARSFPMGSAPTVPELSS